ncbi:hypothetical protein PQX77_020016 [Marasmius sp. AFHP31]|nr:hypothetical protein PQX77_020016 [Marasmius sp. AFHP31]
MQSVPGWGPHYSNAYQNNNHGRDQNINDRGHQNINSGQQVGQVNGGAVNQSSLSAGRDIYNFNGTIANRELPLLASNQLVLKPVDTAGRERLSNAIAGVGASHNAEHQFERGQCLPGTREKAIESIYDWASSNDQTCPVCWLSGPAGVGKSAIALTVAESYEIEGRLASSFFFFRSDSKRNGPSALIPFIAHGLTSITPLMRTHIEQKISEDPKILDATLEVQFRELVLQPALSWGKQRSLWGFFTDLPGSPVVPNIVIIDGLDECGKEDTQRRILSIIQSAYQQAPQFPLRFLICSRPESWIQEAFADDPLFQLSKTIVLDDSPAGREDTRTYYLHHFQEIVTCQTYRHIEFPSPWPSERDLEILVEWACSQFIFAVTVIKFITDAGRHPIDQLRIILEKIPLRRPRTSPYQQLDMLYDLILSANPDPEEVQNILAALLVLEGHLKTNSAHIELVLGLSKGQLLLTLRAMHSVLNISAKSENKIRVHHKSFTDYLCDQTRSRQFHVDVDRQKHAIAGRWLQNFTTSRVRAYTSRQLYGSKARDFFTKWVGFCVSTPEPTRDLLEHLWNVDLASIFLMQETYSWKGAFAVLVPWVQNYNVPRVSGTMDKKEAGDCVQNVEGSGQCEFEGYSSEMDKERDGADLVKGLVLKLQTRPRCFHLECPPGQSQQDNLIVWVVRNATGCSNGYTSPALNGIPPRGVDDVRLTDCHCDLSGGSEAHDPGHLAYQDGCMQFAKANISYFIGFGQGIDNHNNAQMAFKRIVESSLLKHCRVHTELLSLCQTFFEHVKGCVKMRLFSDWGEEGRKNMLEWIETFPDRFAEEGEALKVQILGLPWKRWAQNYKEWEDWWR